MDKGLTQRRNFIRNEIGKFQRITSNESKKNVGHVDEYT
jgi:hypothetical protein